MRRSVLAGVVCGAVTYASAPIVRHYLLRRGSMDVPNHRSSHTTPIPRGGGLACSAGVAAGLLVAGPSANVPARTIAGIATVAAIGWADDLWGGLDPEVRLAVQAAMGALFAPSAALVPLGSILTSGVVNVVNFMDGINGITGSTAVLWGLSAVAAGRKDRVALLQIVGALSAGAGAGFLPWNTPKAHLFLGDVGSYLFGSLMAAGIMDAAVRPERAWVVAAPLLPYGLDATQAIIRRKIAGESLTEAHRDHVYQRLVDHAGLSHGQVTTLHAAAATATSVIARQPLSSGSMALLSVVAGGYIASPRILAMYERARQE